jgi:hypothetical protein
MGIGTRITWRYNMFPGSHVAAPTSRAFGWFCRGYASQMWEELSNWLVD